MKQPPGFEDPSKSHYVCKLKKATYGLKQAPGAWFDKSVLSFLNLISNAPHEIPLYLCIWMGTILCIYSSMSMICCLREAMISLFNVCFSVWTRISVWRIWEICSTSSISKQLFITMKFLCVKRYMLPTYWSLLVCKTVRRFQHLFLFDQTSYTVSTTPSLILPIFAV